MNLEQVAQLLILSHAVLGGLALVAGLVAVIAKKGSEPHRKSGLLFYYSMLVSAASALVIAVLPNHENPFLIAMGVFSSYFIVTGYRALQFKKKNPALALDKFISWVMLATGLAMILLPVILSGVVNILLAVFGTVGLIFALRDLYLFKNSDRLKANWLKLHLGKMLGGYISATTAFVVVNEFLPGYYSWFLPGILGGLYITYWMRKIPSRFLLLALPFLVILGCEGNTTHQIYLENNSTTAIDVKGTTPHGAPVNSTLNVGQSKIIFEYDWLGGNSTPSNTSVLIADLVVTNTANDTMTKDYTEYTNWDIVTEHRHKIPSDYLHQYFFTVNEEDF